MKGKRHSVHFLLLTYLLLSTTVLFGAASGPALASPAAQPDAPQNTVQLQRVASNLARPVDLTAPPGDRARLFVVEKTGYIRIITVVNGVYTLLPTPFLAINTLVSGGSEQGLLGLAFHPNYAVNGYFYINYTDVAGDTVIARYRVSPGNPNLADPASAQAILTVDQPYSNHNGGQLQFGPDGYLYIGLGDGGSGGDPQDRAQNPALLLGKMLRIDVDGAAPYTIPPSNPFVGPGNPLDEIWALGLRNPWRFSFDRLTGDMWIGDVGQDLWEEIDYEPAGDPGGRNWGWRCKEGTQNFNISGNCPSDLSVLDDPVYQYSSAPGVSECAITGGAVYRGSPNSSHFGSYLFADYCIGNNLRTLRYNGSAWVRTDYTLVPPAGQSLGVPTSFGQDAIGNIYVTDYAASNGEVYLLQLRPAVCVAGNFDLNGDGQVDVLDIQLAAGDWQRPDFVPDYDVDCDGVVDIVDVQSVAAAWQG
jgi:glucose/arabinose dehydrogenase